MNLTTLAGICVIAIFACANAQASTPPKTSNNITARFVPASLPPSREGTQAMLALVIRSNTARTAKVELRAPAGITVEPINRTINLQPNGQSIAWFKVKFTSGGNQAPHITAHIDGKSTAEIGADDYIDLNSLDWKSMLDKDKIALSREWTQAGFDDSSWSVRHIPSLWFDIGVTYLRARVFIPESWRGKPVTLGIKAIDDNDICYLNGAEIGRTNGWDVQRSYNIDPKLIKYGEENLLCLTVDNVNAGGGITRSPNYLGTAAPPEPPTPKLHLAAPGKIGEPLPLRPMHAVDGVLRYEDGTEVALWGANYYPQSWYQFENMKRLGVDMKKAIREDLDDMKRMGLQVIRIHVFDREISDADGNLLDNERLDLLDYLISEGTRRGIYFMFTPIAWWWGPSQNPDSFSARTPKEYMYCDDTAIRAQANYLHNWLDHKNRYTGRRYKDEPAVCALEIINEPAYADYNAMTVPSVVYYPNDPVPTAPFKQRLLEKWRKWLSTNNVEDDTRFFPLFRYELMSSYLKTMYDSIRGTGAKQPVASALFDTAGQDDLIQAIADSPCEAVTTGHYPGSFQTDSDGVNLLPQMGNTALDYRLDKKARLVYEFDALRTLGSYLYPTFARRFRNIGVQIACEFQYDSISTAEWNTDWNVHYLNWLYTPGKAMSFRIASKVFTDLPRGAEFSTEGATQTFGNCAVSFDHNVSVYSDRSTFLHSAPVTDFKPLKIPEKPTLIMGVGSSQFVDYKGTGIFALQIDYKNRVARLTINPDADLVGDPWRPDPNKSAVVLKNRTHPFTLTMPGVRLKSVIKTQTETSRQNLDVRDNTFDVEPGQYALIW